MKIGGVEVTACEEILVLPRPTGTSDIVIRAKAVLDFEEFEALCPAPIPPVRIVAGGKRETHESEGYLQALQNRQENRYHYICLKSLEPSEIEWATVDLKKPSTWKNWTQDMADAGLGSTEINRITLAVMSANSLDDRKLKEARESFLRGQGLGPGRSSGQDTGPPSTPSGQPASDSESDPQE